MARNRSHTGQGPSQRQLRVGELIRRRLSEVLAQGDVHDPDLNRMSITVGEVRTTPDLKAATAYVLPLGGRQAAEALAALNRNRTELRRLVTKGLTLKYSPQLRFVLDDTFDRLDDSRRMFDQETVRRDIAAPDDDGDDRNGDDDGADEDFDEDIDAAEDDPDFDRDRADEDDEA